MTRVQRWIKSEGWETFHLQQQGDGHSIRRPDCAVDRMRPAGAVPDSSAVGRRAPLRPVPTAPPSVGSGDVVITLGLSALPSTWRPTGHPRAGLVDVPLDELTDDLCRARLSTAFGGWACGNKRLPHFLWEVDGEFGTPVCWHPVSVSGGYPVSLENGLWVGTHPDTLNRRDGDRKG